MITAKKLPLIIAHRGASGELPEHTMEAYRRAIEQGADFIEPDLVITKDGVLVVRHDRYLSTTTNVADLPAFATRKRSSKIDAYRKREDWWVEDFTLAEIKTLRARQAFRGRSKEFDDLYAIPTFEDVLALSAETGVGIYPETKAPKHHASIGLNFTGPLLAALKDHPTPVFIQSFEAGILRDLNTQSDWPLIQLYSSYPAFVSEEDQPSLEVAATYADGVGPSKTAMTPSPAEYISRARSLGLAVHPYTFRADDLPDDTETFNDELNLYFAAGVDGVFTDFPGLANEARKAAFPDAE